MSFEATLVSNPYILQGYREALRAAVEELRYRINSECSSMEEAVASLEGLDNGVLEQLMWAQYPGLAGRGAAVVLKKRGYIK